MTFSPGHRGGVLFPGRDSCGETAAGCLFFWRARAVRRHLRFLLVVGLCSALIPLDARPIDSAAFCANPAWTAIGAELAGISLGSPSVVVVPAVSSSPAVVVISREDPSHANTFYASGFYAGAAGHAVGIKLAGKGGRGQGEEE